MNKLKLNENKTEAIVVYAGSARMMPLNTSLGVCEGTVQLASTQNLRVILESHLSLDDHVRSICKKAFFHLHRISRIRKYLTQPALLLLQRVQNAAARLITKIRPDYLAADEATSPNII